MGTQPPRPPDGSLIKEWQPAWFAARHRSSSRNPYAICILNQPLDRKAHLLDLCEHASRIICADGGANRLRDLGLTPDEERRCKPDVICGDFDSVRPEVLVYYEGRGAEIVEDKDQYSTDLQKCLRKISRDACLRGHVPEQGCYDIAIFGGLSGRADQGFSLIHQLYALASKHESLPGIGDLYLITRESLIFLLEKGHNRIATPLGPGLFTPNVGILPVGRPSVITTSGLEWDITDWPTEFGGQLSTSNHIKADTVEVESTERVLFTMEFAPAQE